MRIVTQTEALSERFGDQRAVEIICQSGFSGIDYSMFTLNNEKCALAEDDWKDYLKPVKATADRYSVPFTQSHCPFPTAKKDDSAYNKFMLERTKRAFEASAYLGVEIMVVHPVTYDPEGTDFEVNYKLYQQLKPFAEETGVKIALENMWRGRERKITDIFNLTHHISPKSCFLLPVSVIYIKAVFISKFKLPVNIRKFRFTFFLFCIPPYGMSHNKFFILFRC